MRNRSVPIGLAVAALLALGVCAASCRKDSSAAPPPPPPALIPPLHDAAVGEWLRLKSGSAAEMYRVVGAGDYEVTVELTTYLNDAPVRAPETFVWHRNGFSIPPNAVIRAFEPDRIQVAGTWYDCWRLSIVSRDSAPMYYWISDKVGVHGVLKVAKLAKGEPDEGNAATLVDWGPR